MSRSLFYRGVNYGWNFGEAEQCNVVATITNELRILSRDTRRTRRQYLRQRRSDVTDEVNVARRLDRKAEVSRLSRLLSASGTGPEKRNYKMANASLPSSSDL